MCGKDSCPALVCIAANIRSRSCSTQMHTAKTVVYGIIYAFSFSVCCQRCSQPACLTSTQPTKGKCLNSITYIAPVSGNVISQPACRSSTQPTQGKCRNSITYIAPVSENVISQPACRSSTQPTQGKCRGGKVCATPRPSRPNEGGAIFIKNRPSRRNEGGAIFIKNRRCSGRRRICRRYLFCVLRR